MDSSHRVLGTDTFDLWYFLWEKKQQLFSDTLLCGAFNACGDCYYVFLQLLSHSPFSDFSSLPVIYCVFNLYSPNCLIPFHDGGAANLFNIDRTTYSEYEPGFGGYFLPVNFFVDGCVFWGGDKNVATLANFKGGVSKVDAR